MPSLITPGYVPNNCQSNDQRAVHARIEAIQTNQPVTPNTLKYIDEFVRLLTAGMRHRLTPVDVDAVWDKQSRPSQRQLLTKALTWSQPNRVNKAFMKKEAYGEIKDPRVISTINPQDKLNYSRFMYAVTDWLKDHTWYAFGLTPALEIVTGKLC